MSSVQVSVTAETLEKFQNFMLFVEQHLPPPSPSATTFFEFANEWMSIRIDNGISSDNTIAYYKNLLRNILDYFGNWKIDKIRPMDVERFLNSLSVSYSPTTIHHYYRVLRSIFNYAVVNGVVEQNVMNMIRIPSSGKKTLQKDIDFLSLTEAQRLLRELGTAPLRWRCMMMLFVQTGIRRGEACGLTWEDIDFEASTISIRRNVTYSKEHGVIVGKLKTQNSLRTLPLPQRIVQELRAWKAEQSAETIIRPNAYIFSREDNLYAPMFPTAPTKWLSRFTETHNLPRVSPHDLRHTCGSLMLAAGASVKEVQDTLGHTDASITLNFYVGTDDKALKQASDKLASSLGIN